MFEPFKGIAGAGACGVGWGKGVKGVRMWDDFQMTDWVYEDGSNPPEG